MQAAFAAAGPMLGAVSGLGEASFPARIGRFTAGVVAAEMRRAILWFPVGMAAGIALYLGWETEPPVWTALLVLLPLLLSFSPLWRTMTGRLGCLALLAVLAGHGAAQFSAWRAAMPALPGPTMATVEGRVVMLDRSASGAPRVLLDHVALFGRAADATPSRVRLTLSAVDRAGAPRPGDWIQVYARLGPPGQPVEPGAFDFARRAYFERIGAIGYARTPPVRLPAVEVAGRAGRALAEGHGPARWWAGLATAVAAWRVATADAVRARLTGAEGAFAAAILVGDRSAIDERDAEALRVSTLAHLLAISGLHMGLLCGLVFVATRFTLTLAAPLLPWLPGKKAAAAAALAAAAGYLVASGATVATQRAFVMASVALIAVMVDRPALTLRAVALAAVLVLAWRPISLVDPGFQMSFAATVALIATFEALTERRRRRRAEAEDEEGATVDQASDGAVASVAAVNSRLSILAGVVRRLGARLARGAVTVSL
ncbi:MAG: ComEC/Rec2 family competence protein, partial [Pseudomonadota bacterium]